MKNKWRELHYIDLFSGPGFVRIRDSGELWAASPIIAATLPDPFTQIHICDKDPKRIEAVSYRLRDAKLPRPPRILCGDANEIIEEVLSEIPMRSALCTAFIDPYGLHLDFSTVQRIAEKRSDLIILMADNMDALRNWARYYLNNPESNLDRFMGESGWREWLPRASSNRQAEVLREQYIKRLRKLGYEHFGHERVQNDRDRDIYTLLYASRSPQGLNFWRKASEIDESGQRSLLF